MAVAEYQKKIDQLKKQIKDKQAKIQTVDQRSADSMQRIEECNRQRSAHVMAARVGNDTDAQQKLDAAHDNIVIAQREQRDDEAALALLRPQLAALQAAFDAAEENLVREQARDMIRQHLALGLEKKIRDLALELLDAIDDVSSSYKELSRFVLQFDEHLGQSLAYNNGIPFRLDAVWGGNLKPKLDDFAERLPSSLERALTGIGDVKAVALEDEVAVG